MASSRGLKARERLGQIQSWLGQRSGGGLVWQALFARKVPLGVNWFYTLGAASLFLFTLQAVTGIFLAVYYAPTPDHAYDSIQYIMYEVPFGAVIRGIHHWGASAMVVVVVLHMAVAFAYGAYKYPRELTWVVGVGLLVLTLAFGFTGYLLPWDEKAYWATVVGTAIPGTLPVAGDVVMRVMRGGIQLGALTLTRFFAFHTMLLPAALAGLIGVHLFLVILHGVSVPAGLWEKGQAKAQGLFGSRHAEAPPYAQGEAYKARYDELKAKGHRFWPDVIFEDAVVAALILVAIFGLVITVGVPTEARADPTNTAYVPRPEWYFMFLFQALKYFPGSLEWVGAGVLPPLALFLLLLLPLYDRSPWRSPSRRPIAMAGGVFAVIVIAYLTIAAYLT